MKIFFLFPYPLGESPSQRFRFEQYFNLLGQSGFTYQTQAFWSLKAWRILYKKGFFIQKVVYFLAGVLRRLWVITKLAPYDYVFIHRECLPVGPPVFEWFIARILRKKIIYDFDDAIWLPNTSSENRFAAWLKWHGKVSSICRWSFRVSCGNHFLCDYARQFNGNVAYNPTTIDTEYHHNPDLYPEKKTTDEIIIGWTGTHSTLFYLKTIEKVLQTLESRYAKLKIHIIADRQPELNLQRKVFIRWEKETEIQDLMKMDIGIMPLTPDPWSEGKCGFKALQYLALKIPAVASPAGVNSRIIESGKRGFLCSAEHEWLTALEALISDPGLRLKMGEAGREYVKRNYSVVSNTEAFLSLFA